LAAKLKQIRLTSVDLVHDGANQQADIRLFKSLDERAQRFGLLQETDRTLSHRFDWITEIN